MILKRYLADDGEWTAFCQQRKRANARGGLEYRTYGAPDRYPCLVVQCESGLAEELNRAYYLFVYPEDLVPDAAA